MSESFSTVGHASPPTFCPYGFDAVSLPGATPAPPRSPTTTVPIGHYARVTPPIALYMIALSSSFCFHLSWTPTTVMGAPPLPIALEGSPHAVRINGWSFELQVVGVAIF